MSGVLDEASRELLDAPNFAVVATVDPDGAPHTSTVWIVRDGDSVLFSTTTNRRKARNIVRDPRISITVTDRSNPYRSVDLRGTAQLTADPGKVLSKAASRKYLGQDPPAEADEVQRVIVTLTPTAIISTRV